MRPALRAAATSVTAVLAAIVRNATMMPFPVISIGGVLIAAFRKVFDLGRRLMRFIHLLRPATTARPRPVRVGPLIWVGTLRIHANKLQIWNGKSRKDITAAPRQIRSEGDGRRRKVSTDVADARTRRAQPR